MLEEGKEASVVAVFAGMRVESSHSVCSTTCSKYYLDLEIPEVEEFCAKVTLIDIDCNKGWCYLGCHTCQKSMYGAPRQYKCGRCGPIKRPIQWYKLKTKVQDATGTMNLMIFCEVAEELVGVSAEELVDEIGDDDEWYTLPDEIEDLLGSTHTFKVFDEHCDGSFSVHSIMDHGSVHVAAAIPTQCKEEEPVSDSSDYAAVPAPSTTQCKKEPASASASDDNDNTAVPTPTATTAAKCKEEPVSEGSGIAAFLTPTTTQCKCKEEPVPEGSLDARSKSTRVLDC
uniref:Replication factor A C-terminal domain-containing protein n=1 Tax=Leersia perrieri TaxID=77586 RepID=A0A0D9WKN5_9ORYZ